MMMYELADSENGASLTELSAVEEKFIKTVNDNSDVYKMLAAAGPKNQITFNLLDIEFLVATTHIPLFFQRVSDCRVTLKNLIRI